MACPTCDHTMHRVSPGVYWCPRCGRLDDGTGAMNVPSLVERCRRFEANMGVVPGWRHLGILEAIHTPADRERRGAP